MTRQEIEAIISAELNRIAPDIDLNDIDHGENLRDEFDIDSMDFLTLVTVLSKKFNIDMPEADYDQMDSFDALTDYLSSRVKT